MKIHKQISPIPVSSTNEQQETRLEMLPGKSKDEEQLTQECIPED